MESLIKIIKEKKDSNVFGLVPYSVTTTCHFIVTLTISLSVLGIVNIISFQLHGLRAFTAFLP